MITAIQCPTCQKPLTADGIHTCYDISLAVAIKDAEKTVVETAEAWANAERLHAAFFFDYHKDFTEPFDARTAARLEKALAKSSNALLEAVSALRAVRDGQ